MTPPRGPWEPGASAAWSAELECRGCTHDRAGVDVVRVALAVLHLQGDSGVIIWKHKRRNSAHFVSGMQELGRFVTCIVIRCFSANLWSVRDSQWSLGVHFHDRKSLLSCGFSRFSSQNSSNFIFTSICRLNVATQHTYD